MGEPLVYDQSLLDSIFDDVDFLLAPRDPDAREASRRCVNCVGDRVCYSTANSSHPGARVCDDCGVVQPGCVFYETMYGRDIPQRTSNYKRIHHWHERISQLLLLESQIPPADFLRIVEKLCDGTYPISTKISLERYSDL